MMMKQIMILVVGLLLLAGPVSAATVTYSWEDGETILGSYSAITATNDTTIAHSGNSSLELVDGGASGTPQAYVGWVTGLLDGDTVTASFWVYDTTLGTSPSGRLWGHYTRDVTDINSYVGSPGVGSDYSDGTGWSYLEYSWTFNSGTDNNGWVIEARTYSGLNDTIWVDDLTIIAPDYATIYTAGSTTAPAPVPAAAWLFGSGLLGLLAIHRRKA
ncbi:hypothetical protein [Desulfosarcina cetonica]|uniref:hypothetical protein n=1 Tax=Desulfosarcina cetonica TaxID=90730 RepID=UPI0006D292D4|nr:hypothetical protein [Desulfosarcina cetonica]